jgi:tetratricopeptide (TPR) repeat protein
MIGIIGMDAWCSLDRRLRIGAIAVLLAGCAAIVSFFWPYRNVLNNSIAAGRTDALGATHHDLSRISSGDDLMSPNKDSCPSALVDWPSVEAEIREWFLQPMGNTAEENSPEHTRRMLAQLTRLKSRVSRDAVAADTLQLLVDLASARGCMSCTQHETNSRLRELVHESAQHQKRGSFRRAIEGYEASFQLAMELNGPWKLEAILCGIRLVTCCIEDWQPTRAIQVIDRNTEIVAKMLDSHHPWYLTLQIQRAYVLFQLLEDVDAAHQGAIATQELLRLVGEESVAQSVGRAAIDLLLHEGDDSGAERLARAWLRCARGGLYSKIDEGHSLYALASILERRGDYSSAAQCAQDALAIYGVIVADQSSLVHVANRCACLKLMGTIEKARGNGESADLWFIEAHQRMNAGIDTLLEEAIEHRKNDESNDIVHDLELAWSLSPKYFGESHRLTIEAGGVLAHALADVGQLERAVSIMTKVTQQVKSQNGEKSIVYGHVLCKLARLEMSRGHHVAARELYRQSHAILQPHGHDGLQLYVAALLDSAGSSLDVGELNQAHSDLQAARDFVNLMQPSPFAVQARLHMVAMLLELNRTDEARAEVEVVFRLVARLARTDQAEFLIYVSQWQFRGSDNSTPKGSWARLEVGDTVRGYLYDTADLELVNSLKQLSNEAEKKGKKRLAMSYANVSNDINRRLGFTTKR